MTVRCVGCGRSIPVPPDKAAEPRLRVKCPCGAIFLVAEAPRVEDPAAAKAPIVATPAAFATAIPPPAASRAAPAGLGAASSGPIAARPAGAPTVPPAAPVRKPPAPARVASPPSAAVATPPAAATPPPRPVSWRRCVHHPVRAHSVCPACVKGYCDACASGQTVQGAVICPSCDGLCVRASQYEESQTRGQQQARSLMQELGTIVAYPLRDPLGLVMLALFTWFFGVLGRMAMFGGFVGIILSQGVLLSYCFFAVSRVSSGNLRDFTPDFRGISDFIEPLRLGLAVLLISSGPLLLVTFLGLGVALFSAEGAARPSLPVAHAESQPPPSPEEEEEESEEKAPEKGTDESHAATGREDSEEGRPASTPAMVAGGLVFFLALLWKVVYTPAALTVAALSRGFFKTLNPVIGLDTIRKMGEIYWQSLLIYSFFAGTQWLLGVALGFIPIAGGIVRSFVDAYAYLAIGCTLGLAVFKRARELGWD
jgi:hypothetical protein